MTAFMTVFMIHDYLKPLFENVLLKHGGLPHDPMFSLLLSTCFCAELVEGVILSNFYLLSFIIRDLLHA